MRVTEIDALKFFMSESKVNVEQIKEVMHLYEEKIIDNYVTARTIIFNLKSNCKNTQIKGIDLLAYYNNLYSQRAESHDVPKNLIDLNDSRNKTSDNMILMQILNKLDKIEQNINNLNEIINKK